ncbi:MAG: hypothetical protein R3231_04020 [bacterium]|nr:hypothetical protein [bacterium]
MQNTVKREFRRRGEVLTLFLAVAATIYFAGPLRALAEEPVVIIVNAENKMASLTAEEVAQFYNNDKLTWPDGNQVVLYDLKVKDEARVRFSQHVLHKDPEKVAMEWASRKITNTAKNPPRTVSSALLMETRVAKDPAAVGYLLQSQVTSDRVKVVHVIQ